jgi:hypothetical protein
MQGLSVRIARDLNGAMMRRGTVFADRYHAHVLRSPRETRHALLYVLNNARHHVAASGERLSRGWTDPCSSAAAFDGWREGRVAGVPPPVVAPACWLLTTGWRKRGLLGLSEVPAERAAAAFDVAMTRGTVSRQRFSTCVTNTQSVAAVHGVSKAGNAV